MTFLAKDLARLLRGCTIQRVALADDKVLTIALTGRQPLDLRFLHEVTLPLLCVTRPGEALRLSQSKRRAPGPSGPKQTPPGLPRFEEHLVGCTITDVSQIDLDRVIMLTARGEADQIYRLYFELIPPFPNLFLTDGNDTLLEPLFKAGTRTRQRTLARRKPYVAPTVATKIHPVDLTPEDIDALGWQEDEEVLSKTILGISPFFSREIVRRGKEGGSVFKALNRMLSTYRRGQVMACVFTVDSSITKNPPSIGLAWYHPSPGLAEDIVPVGSLNLAAQQVLGRYLRVTEHDRVKAAILRTLSKDIQRLTKAIRQTKGAAGEQQAAARFRRFADILMANLSRIRKGAAEVGLPDLYSADQREIAITLEPRLTPHGNAEAYFKRAKKSERRARLVEQRLKATRARLEVAEALLAEAERPDTDLERLRELAGIVSRTAAGGKEKEGPADEKALRLGIKPRRYTVGDSWTVLVGRSAKENDVLTHRYAAPSDLWFHARHAQGSHVVLRKDRKKTQVPRDAILEAAAIAAYYSKARTSKHVPVSYTEKRYIKRVRKGPPGLCVMLREKVVFVDPALPGHGA